MRALLAHHQGRRAAILTFPSCRRATRRRARVRCPERVLCVTLPPSMCPPSWPERFARRAGIQLLGQVFVLIVLRDVRDDTQRWREITRPASENPGCTARRRSSGYTIVLLTLAFDQAHKWWMPLIYRIEEKWPHRSDAVPGPAYTPRTQGVSYGIVPAGYSSVGPVAAGGFCAPAGARPWPVWLARGVSATSWWRPASA